MVEVVSVDMIVIICSFSKFLDPGRSGCQSICPFPTFPNLPLISTSWIFLKRINTKGISSLQNRTQSDMGNDVGKLKTSTNSSVTEETHSHHHPSGSSRPSDANTDEERRKRMVAINARLQAEASRGLPHQKQK